MTSKTESKYHVGIILDGNGRWATGQGKPRLFGHRAGADNVKRIIEACPDAGVHTVSLYAFAIANWKRDKDEVEGLWQLLRTLFKNELDELIDAGIRLQVIGDHEGLPDDVQKMAQEAEVKSKENTGVHVLLALNYDGVDEIVRATREIAKKVCSGNLDLDSITSQTLTKHLDTRTSVDPDIVIRTGMEQRKNTSGMTLWRSSSFLQLQSAQAVCVSTPVLWPDFTAEDLKAAIAFAKPEERLFGGQRRTS